MEGPPRRKVTAKVDYMRPASRNANASRPGSPTKFQTPPNASLSPPNMPRPKSKVNSSAILPRKLSATTSSSSVSSTSRVNSVMSARSPSPFKPSQGVNGTISPPSRAPKSRVTVRPTSKSVAAPPRSAVHEARQFSSHTGDLDQPAPSSGRKRHGSLSLHHASSSSALSNRPASYYPPTPTFDQSSFGDSADGINRTRVTSKVSAALKASLQSPPSLSSSPPYATTRPFRPRSRPPSISSICLDSPPPPTNNAGQFIYPITTCVPAANPHRFSPARPPHYPPPNHDMFPYADDAAKADAELHIQSPQSPGTSTLSFSSKSSTSRSSASYTRESDRTTSTVPTSSSRINGLGFTEGGRNMIHSRSGSGEGSLDHDSGLKPDGGDYDVDPDDSEDSDHKQMVEAKSNRKIADLEISNRSLLSINISLEATKHRQAKEIRDLRRKLRESMLVLPPRTYQAVKSSLGPKEAQDDEEDLEEELEEEEEEDDKQDPAFRRVKAVLEGLLEFGKRALESKPEDFIDSGKGGTKVLSAEEVRSWRGRGGDEVEPQSGPADPNDHQGTEGETSFDKSVSSSHASVPDTDDDFASEDEVEASLNSELDSAPSSAVPPIMVSAL